MAPAKEEDYSELTDLDSGSEKIKEADSLLWSKDDAEREDNIETEDFEEDAEVIKPRRGRPRKN